MNKFNALPTNRSQTDHTPPDLCRLAELDKCLQDIGGTFDKSLEDVSKQIQELLVCATVVGYRFADTKNIDTVD